MFTPKLIVTDLDGTALNNNKEITAETIKAFERCRKKGIHIAIATARYIVGASYYARKLHADFQILTDGTLVYENGRLVYSRTMTKDMTNDIINELKKYDCTFPHSHSNNYGIVYGFHLIILTLLQTKKMLSISMQPQTAKNLKINLLTI